MSPFKKIIQEAFDSLEAQGLMRKTGELVRGRGGDLQPVYVPTLVSKWLDETGQMDRFLASLETFWEHTSPELKRKGNEIGFEN
jgi:hypothetical protein